MAKEPQDGAPNEAEDDEYEAAELDDGDDLDEDARLAVIQQEEQRESRREILLGKITVARSELFEAEDAGDTAKVAALEQTLAELTREREEP